MNAPAESRIAKTSAPFAALSQTRNTSFRILVVSTVLLLVLRIALMSLLPLADTTEARYGEIARLTLDHGFWLMPHIEINLPFFAKPPLSAWTSAASMYLLGDSEFSARLPSLIMAIATGWVAMAFGAQLGLKRSWLVFPVLAVSPLFIICAGTVMTDSAQGLIISAALYFAWRAIGTPQQEGGRWRMAFWTMIGLGALCKGLANWALIGMPIMLFAAVERKPREIFCQIFDWKGILLASVICIPWYLTAEYYYPGFLNYFIVGEHFSRFLVPGWKGDRYGIAHQQPLGMIWIYWAAAILPWLAIFAKQLGVLLFGKGSRRSSLEKYLWCAILAPLLFFSFAHNIIWTYGLTALIPFSVLAARWLEEASDRVLQSLSWAMLVFCVVIAALFPTIIRNVSGNSDRDLFSAFKKSAPASAELIYLTKPTHSAHFYARARLLNATGQTFAAYPPLTGQSRYFVVDNDMLASSLPPHSDVLFHGTRHSLIEVKS